MDQRKIDAGGGRALHRQKRVRIFAVVFVIQNLLVASSLLVTLYIYMNMPNNNDVHIDFMAIADISSNGTLEFGEIQSNYRMNLVGRDRISVSCTGPYVLYMNMCYMSLQEREARGSLQLQVVGQEKTPLSSFNLTVLKEVCKGHHSIAYLKEGEEASLYLNVKDRFKVKNVTVGLRYLLGNQCIY